MSGYEFDVFISYRRDGNSHEWGRNHFFDRLKRCLEDHVSWQPEVFIDEEIETGKIWPERLRRALSRTKVLVPILSAEYWRSAWCVAEWQSMVDREELLGSETHTLIYPVLYADSENFPDVARTRSWWDLKPWNSPVPSFQLTPAYSDFHKQVDGIAGDLARHLKLVPQWRPDWPIRTVDPPLPPPAKLPRL